MPTTNSKDGEFFQDVQFDTELGTQANNEKKEVAIDVNQAQSINLDGGNKGADDLSVTSEECIVDDPYDVQFVEEKTRIPPFVLMTWKQKIFKISLDLGKFITLLACLYFFIIALDLLGSAFQIISGTTVGKTFRNSDIFNNPIAGLVIGILATVLVQSSSTSTSIIVSMVASHLLTIEQAVYMIMGANIGTSVTNTIVSMTQISNPSIFVRAFAGSTVHDMFNFLSVIILLPLEVVSNGITELSKLCVGTMNLEADVSDADFLKVITDPLTDKIISVNKALITAIGTETNETILEDLYKESMVLWSDCEEQESWFVYCSNQSWSDSAVGCTLLLWSLSMLVICLLIMVKVLQSLLSGNIATLLHKTINTEFRSPFGYLRGYLLILVGVGITILVQSSSVTTSSLVPLVGIGVLNLKTLYPITLGANIGTTVTSVLASFSQMEVDLALTVAFCHLFFNLFGIVLWFVVPITRKVPIGAAKKLGRITGKHRWFAAFYIITVFIVIPIALFGLSLAGWEVMLGVLLPFALVGLGLGVVFLLRRFKPDVLPPWLLKFYWLPKWIRHEPQWLQKIHKKMEKKAAKQEEKEAAKLALNKKTTLEKLYGYLGPLVELDDSDLEKASQDSEIDDKKEIEL